MVIVFYRMLDQWTTWVIPTAWMLYRRPRRFRLLAHAVLIPAGRARASSLTSEPPGWWRLPPESCMPMHVKHACMHQSTSSVSISRFYCSMFYICHVNAGLWWLHQATLWMQPAVVAAKRTCSRSAVATGPSTRFSGLRHYQHRQPRHGRTKTSNHHSQSHSRSQ